MIRTVASGGVVIKTGKRLLGKITGKWTGVNDVTIFIRFRPEIHECKTS